jgi:hypothetical protein
LIFYKFFLDYLNLAIYSFFLIIQNGRKIQCGKFFAQKFMNFGSGTVAPRSCYHKIMNFCAKNLPF